MALRKTRLIDWIIVKAAGDVHLALLDEEDWSDEAEHVALLQEKLNGYLAFVEGGELHEYLETLNRPTLPSPPVTIEIIARCPLPAVAAEFIKYAEETVRDAGFDFSWTHRESATEHDPA